MIEAATRAGSGRRAARWVAIALLAAPVGVGAGIARSTPAGADTAIGIAQPIYAPLACHSVLYCFEPQSASGQVGTPVRWANRTGASHAPVADGGAFSLATIAPGGGASWTPNAPGTYPYHCAVWQDMKGVLVVAPPPPPPPPAAASIAAGSGPARGSTAATSSSRPSPTGSAPSPTDTPTPSPTPGDESPSPEPAAAPPANEPSPPPTPAARPKSRSMSALPAGSHRPVALYAIGAIAFAAVLLVAGALGLLRWWRRLTDDAVPDASLSGLI